MRDEVSGQKVPVKVKRQVVLTGGAIDTARILMESGIGPADHLQQQGVCVSIQGRKLN